MGRTLLADVGQVHTGHIYTYICPYTDKQTDRQREGGRGLEFIG